MIPGRKFNKKYFSSGTYRNYKKLTSQWVGPVAKKIYQVIKNNPSAKILDVGCAQGYLMAELQNKYHLFVEGLDYSSYAVRNTEKSVRKKIRKGNILKLPFKKNSFDVVICFDVANYLTPKETVKAIKNLIDISRNYIFFSAIYRHSRWASQKINPDRLRINTLSQREYINLFSQNRAKFIKSFWGENGGNVLVFKKI